jgi:hypothetical protein
MSDAVDAVLRPLPPLNGLPVLAITVQLEDEECAGLNRALLTLRGTFPGVIRGGERNMALCIDVRGSVQSTITLDADRLGPAGPVRKVGDDLICVPENTTDNMSIRLHDSSVSR